jgi:hypothetical protein
MSGEIIDLTDEANGGAIISKGRVVNQEAIDEMAKKEKDRQTAATALTVQVESPNAEVRNVAPSKLDALEKRIDAQDSKLDAILAALNKK